MTPTLETMLGRASNPEPISAMLEKLRDERVLITGGMGSIGTAVTDRLDDAGIDLMNTDVHEMDVRDPVAVEFVMHMWKPTVVLHLAGAKHAPEGELDPLVPAMVHIDGTDNVLRFAPQGSRVVTASTCKSCDPETAYGASKLIAERMTLNAGHSVARFHNVVETSGNVFEIWEQRDTTKPLQVAACRRYFISLDEAIACVLYAAIVERPGRFMASTGIAHSMIDVARRVYPDAELTIIEPRRGDRLNEPYFAQSESAERETARILRVYSPHDRTAA